MSTASENDLINRLAECIRFFGGDEPDDAGMYDERFRYAYGHSGEGWYLGSASYPDEGAEFIAPLEYGALVVAQAIVAAERGWDGAGAGNPEPRELPAGAAPVSFVAQLMALGSADVLAEDLAAHGSTSVLIFAAEVEEVRKAAPLFRRPVRLTEGDIGSTGPTSARTPRLDGAPVSAPEQAGKNTYSDRGGA